MESDLLNAINLIGDLVTGRTFKDIRNRRLASDQQRMMLEYMNRPIGEGNQNPMMTLPQEMQRQQFMVNQEDLKRTGGTSFPMYQLEKQGLPESQNLMSVRNRQAATSEAALAQQKEALSAELASKLSLQQMQQQFAEQTQGREYGFKRDQAAMDRADAEERFRGQQGLTREMGGLQAVTQLGQYNPQISDRLIQSLMGSYFPSMELGPAPLSREEQQRQTLLEAMKQQKQTKEPTKSFSFSPVNNPYVSNPQGPAILKAFNDWIARYMTVPTSPYLFTDAPPKMK